MKRFTDTEKYFDPWFRKLPLNLKCFWGYVCDNCDLAGVWKVDIELASFQIGEPVNAEEALKAFDGRIEDLGNGRWLIVGFVKFQYGTLSLESRVHGAVISLIEKHGLQSFFQEAIIPRSLTTNAQRKRITETTRLHIFKRDGFRCQYCGEDSHSLLRLDHIVPIFHQGDNSNENLVTSCVQCNSKKGVTNVFQFIEVFNIKPLDSLSKLLQCLSKKLDRPKDKDKDKDKDKVQDKVPEEIGGVGERVPVSTPTSTQNGHAPPQNPFERFWASYPRKQAKKDAEKAFKTTSAEEHIDRILQSIESQTKSEAWVKESGRYIPLPATWLRGERWLDEQFTQVKEEEFGTRRASRFRIQSTKGWIYWTRTDGGPRREQFGKGEDQERTYRCCVEAYNAWIGNPQLA